VAGGEHPLFHQQPAQDHGRNRAGQSPRGRGQRGGLAKAKQEAAELAEPVEPIAANALDELEECSSGVSRAPIWCASNTRGGDERAPRRRPSNRYGPGRRKIAARKSDTKNPTK
jgi:hypothetical protein